MKNQFVYDFIYKVKNSRFNRSFIKSYSQEGEDLILTRIFENQKIGFYVDVGAFHPVRFSNTYLFYKRGWRGINIEARPGSKKLFDIIRSRDVNVEVPISDNSVDLTYYCFNEPALNGFSSELTTERIGLRNYKVIDEIKMKTKRLDEILDTFLPLNQKIDFLSIDVESLDINVLKSNNWSKYKPRVIVIEDLDFNFNMKSKISEFLLSQEYKMFARTVNTSFFIIDA